MSEWTPSAKAELETYFRRVRPPLEQSGADATEVIEDLKRHLDEEVAASRLTVVTEDDVRRMLNGIGGPEAPLPDLPGPSGPAPEPNTPPAPVAVKRPSVWLLLFGVVLPALTLAIEGVTAMCAEALFDPIPTIWHGLLLALVPLANGLTWFALAQGKTEWRSRLGWANGAAIGISLFYAIIFLPLVPPGLLGVLLFGFGFLPLTPMLALIATVGLRAALRRLGADGAQWQLPGLWRAMAIGFVALLLLELPVAITRLGMKMAIAEEARTSTKGVRWLRALGNEESLLRQCYGRARWAEDMDMLGFLIQGNRRITTEEARIIYYRVTGRPFNAVPPPEIRTARGRWTGLDDFVWDADQGGDAVAGRIKGLSLTQSRLDGVAEAAAALAYLEWTVEFKNVSTAQREARAQIALPPGGVVSRLTLWVNGEEREAAFAGRGQVREAYQSVVRQRRDPVLVTTSGADRVLMQCFPVPPDGGTMKVRLGITAPLALQSHEEGWLQWPVFGERNFNVSAELKHSVWLESRAALASNLDRLKAAEPKPEYFTLRGDLDERELNQPQAAVRIRLGPESHEVWTPASQGRAVVCQRMAEEPSAPPSRVVMVVDGSVNMSSDLASVAAALSKLPEGIEFSLLLASEGTRELMNAPQRGTRAVYEAAGRNLLQAGAGGGQDNVPTLTRAWDLAAASSNSVLVWIHGPQPVLIDGTEPLRQRFDRRRSSPRVLDLQTRSGPNRVAEKLEGVATWESVPRFGTLEEDLAGLFSRWRSGAPVVTVSRLHMEGDRMIEVLQLSSVAGKHLERLWANEEVRRLIAERKITQAVKLSATYQIVTPVSGAVVLETREQYARAGLQPVDAATVPAVPEPPARLLVLFGGAVLLAVSRYRLPAVPRD